MSRRRGSKITLLRRISQGVFLLLFILIFLRTTLIGEDEFHAMVHQGKGMSVYLETVDSESILGVVFDKKTTLGLVKLRVSKSKRKLSAIVAEARSRTVEPSVVGQGFAEEATSQLDELFGG